MEKEEQKWEQAEVEEEQEEEETGLQVRKSRPVNETGSTESAVVETEKNNGTSESNGHEIQPTVAANGTKDFESTVDNGEGKDELDGVVGNEEEISNGIQKSDNLVFFEEAEGNEFTPPNSGDQQIEKSNEHNEPDILSLEFDVLHNSMASVNGGSEGHLNDDRLSYSNYQQKGIREDDVLSNSDLKFSGEIKSEEHLEPGDELEATEIDVEQVLQKQTTHDLYCPNCNSCITQRVILRKRKRGIRLSGQNTKHNKSDVTDSKLDADPFQAPMTAAYGTDYNGVDSAPLPATNDTDHDREPDLFRCLSCFCIFFPTWKKLDVNVKDEQVSSTKKNWFTSMLAFNKPETAVTRGKDTVIDVDEQPVGSSQNPEETNSALHSAPQATVTDAEGTEVRNEFEIEVIKSIVYGGLAESITSLGVVSSAAGGAAATLNILALGIASLIGGLFVICQNLWELRSECIEQAFNHVSPVIEQRDRYKELLGRKENFIIHAIVSILSYIIFGLVAPVAYGFSFRKSDNKEFKLIVVAAASLLCICGLAVGRAYVRRPPRPYVKSVATYVILGFMVSGVSYVAGVLVERILEKLGLFHSSSGANLPLPQMETVPSYSGYWTSY